MQASKTYARDSLYKGESEDLRLLNLEIAAHRLLENSQNFLPGPNRPCTRVEVDLALPETVHD